MSPGRGGGGYRPLSAPPRPAPPHSPRVLELVEKSESVAWKLVSESCTVLRVLDCAGQEYEGAQTPLLASPAAKRKLSPQVRYLI